MTHTLGPWRAVDLRHQKNGQVRIFGITSHVANVLASSNCCEANARLIAAAPELLEACKVAHINITGLDASEERDYVLSVLQAAIAKAESR